MLFFNFFKICTTGDDDTPPGRCANCGEDEYLCAHCDFVSFQFFFKSSFFLCCASFIFYCAHFGEDEYLCAHCDFVIFFVRSLLCLVKSPRVLVCEFSFFFPVKSLRTSTYVHIVTLCFFCVKI